MLNMTLQAIVILFSCDDEMFVNIYDGKRVEIKASQV